MRRIALAVAVVAFAVIPPLASAAEAAPITATQTAQINDPLVGQQWGLVATNASGPPLATARLRPIVVAVVDSGVDASHPDLAGRVLPGWNIVDNSPDTHDDNGHGTAVAGIIAAATGNGIGIASYCRLCSILPVKVLDAHGVGDTENVASGIRWAADHGARIINVSVGTLVDNPDLRGAVTYARSRNALVIAAAGNLGLPRLEYPAADPGALAVAGFDTTGSLFSWSANGSWVQLAAPGSNVTTALGGGYQTFVGTSSAAPVVSGIAAEALSAAPSTNADALALALEQSAHATAGVEFGRVDAGGTVAALLAHVPPTPLRATTSVRVSADAS